MGIVLAALGTPAATTGIVLLEDASSACVRYNMDPDDHERCVNDGRNLGILVAVAGGAATAFGVPLIIWGAGRAPRPPAATVALNPWVSATGAGARLQVTLW